MNGVLETLGSPSENTSHLAGDFIATVTDRPWSVAVQLNSTCAESCHLAFAVRICSGNGHALRSPYPYTPRFGESSTPADADGSSGTRHVTLHVDSDISTWASPEDPDYALCVSCHDPHGSDLEDLHGRSNSMLRKGWRSSSELCLSCHMDVTFVDSDGDGLSDDDEVGIYLTDPFNPDTDGDGLTDGDEVSMAQGSGCPDPLLPDSDGDLLPDGGEVFGDTSPCDPDSDEDGLSDFYDPYPADPDGTQGYVEEELRYCVFYIENIDPGLIEARNINAAESHRRWMARRISAAADAVHNGNFQAALDKIGSLLARIDSRPKPKDWLADSEEKTYLLGRIEYLIYLLEYLK
jgi:predicted CXXCH cytochrome family protein